MNVLNKYKDITMKITAISDLHGNLINIEPCDILLICGNILDESYNIVYKP